MSNVSNLLQMQIILLTLMAVGLICYKVKIIDDRSRSSLSELVLNVFLPCTTLASFLNTDPSKIGSMGVILAVSVGVLTFAFLISKPLYMKFNPEQKKVLTYATIISNANFLGNPIIESIYGLDGLSYTAVYLIPVRVTILSLGIMIFAGGKGNVKKIIFHPCLIATYLGFAAMVTGFEAPPLFSKIILMVGSCTTPVSMIVVGSILGLVEPKKLVSVLAFFYSFIRLIFIPLVVLGIMLLIRPDPMVIGVTVVLSGTPAPITTTILASKYKSDSVLASKMLLVSTIISMVSIPALLWLLQAVM